MTLLQLGQLVHSLGNCAMILPIETDLTTAIHVETNTKCINLYKMKLTPCSKKNETNTIWGSMVRKESASLACKFQEMD